MTGILIRTKGFGNRDTHAEGRPWDGRAEIGVIQLQARERQGSLAATRNPESGLLQILPRAIEGDVAPPAPGFQTSSFQNYEKINLCCLKPPSLW